VRLIDDTGANLGVVTIDEALGKAWEKGYDLVEVGPGENPPVCRMVDFGKLKYKERKKRASSRQGAGGELKEIGLSMKIGDHDLDVKITRAKKFLERGYKVKFNLLLRGREKAFQDTLAIKHLDRVVELMSDVASVDSRSKGMVGSRLFVIMTALRGKPSREDSSKHAKGKNAQGDGEAGSPDEKREAS